MNFAELYLAAEKYDEVKAIGGDIERDGRFYHIVGMTRSGRIARLYILEELPEGSRESATERPRSNRDSMLLAPEDGCFSSIRSIETDNTEMEVRGMCREWLGSSDYCHSILFFHEMMKAGWELSDDSRFLAVDWESICLTSIDFETEKEKLPEWEAGKVRLKYGRGAKKSIVGKRLCLKTGNEAEIEFSLDSGKGICYINKVYPIDVWEEQEKRFDDPRYLEIMTREELESHKKEFFEILEEECPRGMCYLGIEYECEPEGSVCFYDADFLDAEPKSSSGSARIMMMTLRPDEPTGMHGLTLRGCIIQTPVKPDIREITAELLYFLETVPEREEII